MGAEKFVEILRTRETVMSYMYELQPDGPFGSYTNKHYLFPGLDASPSQHPLLSTSTHLYWLKYCSVRLHVGILPKMTT